MKQNDSIDPKKKASALTALLVSFLVLNGSADAEQKYDDFPSPEPPKEARSLSSALKAIRGEESDTEGHDVVLLDDNSIVEVWGPTGKHDAYIFFCLVPCKAAVPILISSLTGYQNLKAKGVKSFDCTWLHLQGALRSQTGENFGFDQTAWQKWWDSKGKDLPDAFFEENILRQKRSYQMPKPAGAGAPVSGCRDASPKCILGASP